MKKVLLSFFMILLMLLPVQATAYDWYSEEGTYYMLNEEYQTQCMIDACINLYDDYESARQCSRNAYESYIDIVKSIIFIINAEEEYGVSMDKQEKCITKALDRYWNTDTNTANWYRVRKVASECLD